MAQFFALSLEDAPPVRSSGAGDSLDGEGKTVAGWHGEAKMEVGVVGSDEEEEASCLAQVRKRGRNLWLSNTVFVPDLVWAPWFQPLRKLYISAPFQQTLKATHKI